MVSDDEDNSEEADDSAETPESEAEQSAVEEDEEAWDAGVEDLPEVEEAWESVVEDSPEDGGDDELRERIEHDVSRGGVRRALVVVSSALVFVLAIALVLAMLRNDSDDSDDSDEPLGEQPAQSATPPPSVVDDAEEILVNPEIDLEFTAVLDEVVALEEGSGPESERIALDVADSDLPAPSGSVAASLVFFDGTSQVLMIGPSRWLNSACIQTTVVTSTRDAVDAAYHDTPTGVCGAGGIGRQSQVSCIGEDVIMLDLDLVDAGATSGSERLVAETVRVALVDFPDDFEKVSLLGSISLPEEFGVSDLPLARAPVGAELEVTFPSPAGEVTATCLTR